MPIYDDILERLDNYTQYSNYVATNCIFHDDQNPSLFIYEDLDKPEGQGRFYCSGCQKSGTHSYLWKVLSGNSAKIPSVRKFQKFLPNWEKWERLYGDVESLVRSANQGVHNFPDTHSWYFKKRQLMPLVDKCLLGYKDEWAFFPIMDMSRKIIDVIVRDSKGRSKYIIHHNEEETPLLYVPNWKRVIESKLVYIVYGIVDALALELCELPVITGSTGKSLSNKRLIQLNKKYVIIPDKNEHLAARNLASSLGNFTKVIRLPYEEDTKDPDDIRIKYGVDYLKRLINL